MTRLKGLMVTTSATLGLALVAICPVTAAPYFRPQYNNQAPYAEGQGPMRLQDLIARTQTDLRSAMVYATNGDQRGRTKKAERKLSDFDKHLTHGHWNGDDLKDSISSVKDVLDHNTLNAANRDLLRHDLEALKIARDRHQS